MLGSWRIESSGSKAAFRIKLNQSFVCFYRRFVLWIKESNSGTFEIHLPFRTCFRLDSMQRSWFVFNEVKGRSIAFAWTNWHLNRTNVRFVCISANLFSFLVCWWWLGLRFGCVRRDSRQVLDGLSPGAITWRQVLIPSRPSYSWTCGPEGGSITTCYIRV